MKLRVKVEDLQYGSEDGLFQTPLTLVASFSGVSNVTHKAQVSLPCNGVATTTINDTNSRSSENGAHQSNKLQLTEQEFQWALSCPLLPEDCVTFHLNHCTRRRNKSIGRCCVYLQRLIEKKQLSVTDVFCDSNNRTTNLTIRYTMLYEGVVEKANQHHQLTSNHTTSSPLSAHMSIAATVDTPTPEPTESTRLLPVQINDSTSLSPSVYSSTSAAYSNCDNKSSTRMQAKRLLHRLRVRGQNSAASSKLTSKQNSAYSLVLNDSPQAKRSAQITETQKQRTDDAEDIRTERTEVSTESTVPARNSWEIDLTPRTFQVCVAVIEARLSGPSMDPCVGIQAGTHTKYTAEHESTHRPVFNEYFVFDFYEPAALFYDKLLILTVYNSKKILRRSTIIGQFKMDFATIYQQPDHQYYHKWAVLTDRELIFQAVKGYLKVDVTVLGKDDNIRPLPKADVEDEEDNIENNLLVPDANCRGSMQQARYVVRVHSAQGLVFEDSMVNTVKRRIMGDAGLQPDESYVQVTFAGNTAETSSKPGACPAWHEQIVFTEFFPPLVRRIRIQLKTRGRMGTSRTVATHWLDLADISDKGTHAESDTTSHYSNRGFLPTFGPAYIYLYGPDTEMATALDLVTGSANDALLEGCSYRGRLLISLHVLVCDDLEKFRKGEPVTVEPCQMVTERNLGQQDNMLLFGCFMDVTMLDRALVDTPVQLAVTIGRIDDVRDTPCQSTDPNTGEPLVSAKKSVFCGGKFLHTKTPDVTAVMHPMSPHCSVQFGDRKPCVYISDMYPDSIFRLYHSNVVLKLYSFLENSLADVQFVLQSCSEDEASEQLNDVLDRFLGMAYKYQNYLKNCMYRDRMNRLDQERAKSCEKQVDRVMGTARKLRAASTCAGTSERCQTMQDCLDLLQQLAREPQSSLPDIFVILLSNSKRVAYTRIAAQSLIHSQKTNERGVLCGRTNEFYLKPYGKQRTSSNHCGPAGLVHAYFWLGFNKKRESMLEGLPKGYAMNQQIRSATNHHLPPPGCIEFEASAQNEFELRCHLYQARSLLPSDDIGLSDPFARVIFQGRADQTRTIHETLNPEWNQTLVISPVILYGNLDDINRHPPIVVVELFDEDQLGDPEALGQTSAEPQVKLINEPYERTHLQWYSIYHGCEPGGELLAAFELIQLGEDRSLPSDVPVLSHLPLQQQIDELCTAPIINVPPAIRPVMAKYRMEVLLWGLRELKRVNLMSVERPRIDIEVAGRILSSGLIFSLSTNPNFPELVKSLDIELPEQTDLWPAISIRCYDCRSFGRDTLVGNRTGVHVVRRVRESTCSCQRQIWKQGEVAIDMDESEMLEKRMMDMINQMGQINAEIATKTHEPQIKHPTADPMNPDLDWWSKYWASVDHSEQSGIETTTPQHDGKQDVAPAGARFIPKSLPTKKLDKAFKRRKKQRKSSEETKQKQKQIEPKPCKLKVYSCELESLPEFNKFEDWIRSYDLTRGKHNGKSEQERKVGCFKGAIEISKYPLPSAFRSGIFQHIPSNQQIHVLVRVYVVKANDLHPMDINGKSDPYLYITLGKTTINDKENYVSKQLNPVFGKCFEIEALFPHESQLCIQVYDWDLVGRDDLIGETKIDLENRFYSRHRATCGIGSTYHHDGYNAWRDYQKPTQILTQLCRNQNLNGPFYQNGQVRIESHFFRPDSEFMEAQGGRMDTEALALYVLQHWYELPQYGCHLVPEHVETRPLYRPDKHGIVQGQLEMWVDMFPMNVAGAAKPAVDIAPRKPESYELRVIIWNTDEVVLEDDELLTGEKSSDIYVSGKLKGPEDLQSTDVHYRSLTGEGNFNWRFIFPFEYLEAEEVIVLTRKESFLSWDESEIKIPPKLELQVWDADNFSADDFLGAIVLNLTAFPRGAKTAKRCSMELFVDAGDDAETLDIQFVNLFKCRRIRGWWPMAAKNDVGQYELTGKVEAELHLMTKDEAERNPAGLGRNEPNPLDPPQRPDSSFMWFVNPMLSARHILWRNHKWAILKLGVLVAFALLALMFLYSLPGYLVKKLLDV